jgi:signal transduction histidine kinase
MEARPEETDVLELVQSCYKMLQPLADDKGLEFHLKTENFQHKIYTTDPKMFKQILLNLISNAIKFTKEGFIHLELSNDKAGLLFKVTDSGVGIAKENIDQLFNDFTQVENVMQKQHKGTGLGLSLSKKLAHILGGDVTLMSDGIGHGTASCFNL